MANTPRPEGEGLIGNLKTKLGREGLLTGAMTFLLVEGHSHVAVTSRGEAGAVNTSTSTPLSFNPCSSPCYWVPKQEGRPGS